MRIMLGDLLAFIFIQNLLALGGLLLRVDGGRDAVMLGTIFFKLELLLDVI